MDNLEKTFVDEKGEEEKVVAESTDSYQVANIGKYNIANKPSKTKSLVRRKSILTSNIGPTSRGFVPIASLAALIAVATIVILYLVFKF